jgi:hypothetical protein
MYARLTADLLSIEVLNALTDEQYASLLAANNPKTLRHRLQVIAPVPALTATQKAVALPWAVEAERVFQDWQVVEKNADELEADSLAAEFATLSDRIAEIAAQRNVTREVWDAYTANQLRAEQWRDRQALLRAAHFLLRRARRVF